MRFRNLERYKTGGSGTNMQLSIPLPKTPDDRVYRYSPNENAHPRHFVLGQRVEGFTLPESMTPRMTHEPGIPETVCPYSGMVAADNDFTHPDDMAAGLKVVEHAFHADAADAVHDMLDDLAGKFSSSKFIKVETSSRPLPKPAPRFVRSDLLRELVCDECGRDYGVFAISLFCPDCGAPNIHLHFAREVALVREQVELAGRLGREQSELAYRLMGNAHEDVLTAFEATLKTIYLYKVVSRSEGTPEVKPVGNAFQNIERGQKRFAEFDFDPYGGLSPAALAVLTLNIQKRHVIGHNLGVADAAFAEHAADARLGETVPLVGDDILQFAEIGQMVVSAIDAWLANGTPPVAAENVSTKPIVVPAAKEPAALKIGELGPLAIRIGLWVSEQSEKGFNDFIPEDELVKAFPEASGDELGFAVAELSKDDYLNTTSFIGKRLPRMTCNADLYITFDPHAVKTDPEVDVVALVDMALAKTNTVGADSLHQETGWPLRRFNPAFAYMLTQLDDRRVLKGGTNEYPARGFFLIDGDRVDLHRFAARLRR
jgi:hypothetical protein